jgi:hypothetical protein
MVKEACADGNKNKHIHPSRRKNNATELFVI